MIGLDTTVLIGFEIKEHPLNAQIRIGLSRCLEKGELFALTPQVFHEFLHVATDAKRFKNPLTMEQALLRIVFWREAKEVQLVYPGEQSLQQFEQWMREFKLGRKRILDTALASIYKEKGIYRLATANPGDFALFNTFTFEDWARVKEY